MTKFLIFIVIITIACLNANLIIKQLPNSDFKLKVSLAFNKSKIETLFSILDNSEYTNIFWMKNIEFNAGVRTENGIVWDKTPELDTFVSKAESYGYHSLLTSKNKQGNWLLSGYKEIISINESLSKVKTVTIDYSYGQKPKLQTCNSEVIASSFEGQCYLSISNSWFIYKYWFTYDSKSEQT